MPSRGLGLGLHKRFGGSRLGLYPPYFEDAIQYQGAVHQDESTGLWYFDDIAGKRDGEIFLGGMVNVDTSTVFTSNVSLAGISIVSYSGTASIQIVDDTITVSSAGTLMRLVLSNGAEVTFEDGEGEVCRSTDPSLRFTVSEYPINFWDESIEGRSVANELGYNEYDRGFSSAFSSAFG